MLRDIAIGHNYDHWFGLTLSDKVVENLCCTTLSQPSLLITSDTMEEIEYRVALARILVTCWSIDSESAVDSLVSRMVPYPAHCSVRYVIDLEVVGELIAIDQEDARKVIDVAVDIDIGRIDHSQTIDLECIGIEFRSNWSWSCKLPYSILAFLELSNARSIESSERSLDLLSWQEVTSHLNLHSLWSLQTESDSLVGIDLRRLDLCRTEEVLLSKSSSCCHESNCQNCNLFHFEGE